MLRMFCPLSYEFYLHSLAVKMRFYCYQHFQIISELTAVVACRKKISKYLNFPLMSVVTKLIYNFELREKDVVNLLTFFLIFVLHTFPFDCM